MPMYRGRYRRRYGRKSKRRIGYKRSKLRSVGFKPGTTTSKQRMVINPANTVLTSNINSNRLYVPTLSPGAVYPGDFNSWPTKALYAADLTRINEGGDIRNRERAIVNLRGFRIRTYLKSNNELGPIWVNLAIVAANNESAVLDDIDKHFFRRFEGSVRTEAWSDAVNNRTGLEINSLPLSQVTYKTIWHHRFILNAEVGSTSINAGALKNWATKSRYIRINRQIRYGTQLDGDCLNKFWFLLWTSAGDEGTALGAGTITGRLQVVTYFRDPRN